MREDFVMRNNPPPLRRTVKISELPASERVKATMRPSADRLGEKL